MLFVSPQPVVVHVSSGSSWLAYLLGAATALTIQLVIQLYVVPRVETRKRREDRWECDVRDFGQLLAGPLTDLANDAHAAQLVYRSVRDEPSDEYDPALVKRQAREAEKAVFAYGGIISTQMHWLTGRVLSISPKARRLAPFEKAARNYRIQAVLVRPLPDDDQRTDAEFDEGWKKEAAVREALVDQVEVLANLGHPPRRNWRTRAQIRLLRRRSSPPRPSV
jgi:hypothetical protein